MAVFNEYLHVECEAHAGVKVGDEHLGHVLDERLLRDQPVITHVKHLKESVVDDAREVAVFDECDLVQLFVLDGRGRQTPQDQVLVEVLEVRVEEVLDEFGVASVHVEVLDLDVALNLGGKHYYKVLTIIYYRNLFIREI